MRFRDQPCLSLRQRVSGQRSSRARAHRLEGPAPLDDHEIAFGVCVSSIRRVLAQSGPLRPRNALRMASLVEIAAGRAFARLPPREGVRLQAMRRDLPPPEGRVIPRCGVGRIRPPCFAGAASPRIGEPAPSHRPAAAALPLLRSRCRFFSCCRAMGLGCGDGMSRWSHES